MLIESDRAYLGARGFRYDVAVEGGMVCLIIYDYRLPAGYNRGVTDLLLRLPAGFPTAAPDMWWMDPEVLYGNGRVPAATQHREQIRGRIWQRWSRHLAISWRPGTDSLQTYLRLIQTDLEAGVEVQRKAA